MNIKRRMERNRTNGGYKEMQKTFEKMERSGFSRMYILKVMEVIMEDMAKGIAFDIEIDYSKRAVTFYEYDAVA